MKNTALSHIEIKHKIEKINTELTLIEKRLYKEALNKYYRLGKTLNVDIERFIVLPNDRGLFSMYPSEITEISTDIYNHIQNTKVKTLDSDDLYAAIKGCTHDYDPYEKNTWGPILGRYFCYFEKYFLDFQVTKDGLNPTIEVSIHNYVDPNEDEREGSDFLDAHTFDLTFKNVEKKKMPHECIDINEDLILYLEYMLSFLLPADAKYDPKELCEVFLEVLKESEVWQSLVRE